MNDASPVGGTGIICAGSAGERLLQDRFGTRERAQRFYEQQVLDHLNPRMHAFIARQEMMFVATSDANGHCDNSFRAGPAGFVRPLDPRRLAWPEYRGNGVLSTLGNIVENPHISLLFVDFFEAGVGLHVNAAATIVDDAVLRVDHPDLPTDPVPGRRTPRWVVAHVHEAYIHCAKFIPRLYKSPVGERPHHPKPAVFVDRRPAASPPVRAEPSRPEPRRPPVVPRPAVPAGAGAWTEPAESGDRRRPRPERGFRLWPWRMY